MGYKKVMHPEDPKTKEIICQYIEESKIVYNEQGIPYSIPYSNQMIYVDAFFSNKCVKYENCEVCKGSHDGKCFRSGLDYDILMKEMANQILYIVDDDDEMIDSDKFTEQRKVEVLIEQLKLETLIEQIKEGFNPDTFLPH